MAFNGSGVYSLYSPGNPVVTNTTISSSWANNTLTDIATALSTTVLKDGQQTTTARVPFAAGISNGSQTLTAVASGTATTHAATVGQIQSSASTLIGTIAGTNTITGVLTPTLTAYASGQMFVFLPANTNTGATTINIDSVGAKSVFRNGLALVGGELKKSQPVLVEYDGTQFNIVATAAALVQRDVLGYISGLTYSNNGLDAVNDIDIAAGVTLDSTGVYLMRLGSSITKQLDAAWAVGTNQGGLDTGAVGNSDYYLWLIARSDTGVVDALFSLSSTAPTMPSNYDYKRLIGWFKRVGGTIVGFKTYETEGGGVELLWNVPTLDVDLANTLTTSRRTDAVKVPQNFSVEANLSVEIGDASTAAFVWVYCPDQTDTAPSATAAPLANMSCVTAYSPYVQMRIRTSATGTIAARSTLATVDEYRVATIGFRWARRN